MRAIMQGLTDAEFERLYGMEGRWPPETGQAAKSLFE
jgi:hypothetical protein